MIYKELTKKISMAGLADLLVRFKSFIFIPIISKVLGASSYGVWAQLMVTINLAVAIVIMGMNFGFLRFLPGRDPLKIKDEVASVISSVMLTSIMGALAIICFSGFLSKTFFGGENASSFIKVGGLYLITVPVRDLLLIYFRARERIVAYLSLVTLDAAVSIVVLLSTIRYGLNFMLTSLIISNTLLIAIYWIFIHREIGFKLPHYVTIKKYFIYSLPFISITLLLWVNNSSDRYFIGYFKSIKDVGIYSASYSIAYFVLSMIVNPLYLVFQPIVTRLWNNSNQKSAVQLLSDLIRYAIFFMIPIAIGFFILSKTIIYKFTTADFTTGVVIIPFILLGYFFYLTTILVEIVIYLREVSNKLVFIYFISALCNIVLNIILIPLFGILGAAISTAFSFLIQFLLTYFIARKLMTLKVDKVFFLKTIVAAVAMLVVIIQIPQNTFFHIIFIIFCGALIYLAVAFLLKVFQRSQIESIRILLS